MGKQRAADGNAVSDRPTVPRRDGGGVAVSTAMESQRKGSTSPGIHIGRYFVRRKINARFLSSL